MLTEPWVLDVASEEVAGCGKLDAVEFEVLVSDALSRARRVRCRARSEGRRGVCSVVDMAIADCDFPAVGGICRWECMGSTGCGK